MSQSGTTTDPQGPEYGPSVQTDGYSPGGETVLEVDGLGKSYDNGSGVQVFENLSLEIRRGELMCLLGPSGCGKTTLLHLMAGLEFPSQGRVYFQDEPVAEPDYRRGVVFQDPLLYPWLTVRENIEFGPALRGETTDTARVDELIELIGLEDFEDSYPRTLSGGMAQRVSLARTLANDPELLLLDEPFAALDALTRMELQNELLRIRKALDLTVVFVTHDIEEAVYLGDRVAVLSETPGQIQGIESIELERPRERGSYEFLEQRHEIFQLFTRPRTGEETPGKSGRTNPRQEDANRVSR